MNWQMQDAKRKLGKVIEETRKSGPQIITVRGKESAVVMSVEDYQRMAGKKGESLTEIVARSRPQSTDPEIE